MRLRLFSVVLLAVACGAAATPAFASRDVVQFGSNIVVEPGTSVHDAVCFFCSVDNRGTVDGDIVVFFGSVRIHGQANHDVVNFFGSVEADDNSVIRHDLVSMFGSLRLGENVAVGGDMVAMFGDVQQKSSVTVGRDRVVQPAWIFWGPLFLIVLVGLVVVREVRDSRRRRMYAAGYPFPPQP